VGRTYHARVSRSAWGHGRANLLARTLPHRVPWGPRLKTQQICHLDAVVAAGAVGTSLAGTYGAAGAVGDDGTAVP
jgi:hypothetical protein